jgi:hypothetical protein
MSTAVTLLTLIFIIMLCLGASMWADGESHLHVVCNANKLTDSLIFTPAEVDARYNACIANANAEVRWSMPVCLVGAIGLVIMSPFYLYLRNK